MQSYQQRRESKDREQEEYNRFRQQELEQLASARTFKEWKALGYYVCKGQRATGYDANGVPTFTKAQVSSKHYSYGEYGDEDYLDDHWWISADIGDR